DYIDGTLNDNDSHSLLKLSSLNKEMKNDIDSMVLANSFYGRVDNEVAQLDPEILKKWKTHEKKIQKSKQTLSIYEWFLNLSPLKLISGSAISGAALASITMFSFTSINTYSVLRSGGDNGKQLTTQSASNQINKLNIPSQWITQNGILASFKINNKNILDIKEQITVLENDRWNFVLVASEDKLLNIRYVDEDTKNIIETNLNLKKGQTYFSKVYQFSAPLLDGQLIINQNGEELLNVKFKLVKQ
ncbi:hypothetical protein PQZ43_03440, partial [Alphaproteobacteria bacterium]|nr:hypothetical protein [Alphaproteobacteria bacterium]